MNSYYSEDACFDKFTPFTGSNSTAVRIMGVLGEANVEIATAQYILSACINELPRMVRTGGTILLNPVAPCASEKE